MKIKNIPKIKQKNKTRNLPPEYYISRFKEILGSLLVQHLPSVSVDSLLESSRTIENGKYHISLKFREQDVFRYSLYNKRKRNFTGKGVDNIVVLLNNGYSTHKKVYGIWVSRGVETYNLRERQGLKFMQEAEQIFNSRYAKQNTKINIGDKYYNGRG